MALTLIDQALSCHVIRLSLIVEELHKKKFKFTQFHLFDYNQILSFEKKQNKAKTLFSFFALTTNQ